VNRQIGVGDSKYAVIFGPLQPDHVKQRMRNVLWPFKQGKCKSERTFTAKYLGNRTS